MARNRIVQQQLFKDERLLGVPPGAVAYLIGLMTEADDYGNVPVNPKLMLGLLFSAIDVSVEDIESWTDLLADKGFLEPYEAEGKHLAHIVGWNKRDSLTYQVIDRKSQRKFPTLSEGSSSTQRVRSEGSARARPLTRTGTGTSTKTSTSTVNRKKGTKTSTSTSTRARKKVPKRPRRIERSNPDNSPKVPRRRLTEEPKDDWQLTSLYSSLETVDALIKQDREKFDD